VLSVVAGEIPAREADFTPALIEEEDITPRGMQSVEFQL